MPDFLTPLEGTPFAGKVAHIERKSGRFREEVRWKLVWEGESVAIGLAFSGRGQIPRWLDFEFFPPSSWTSQDFQRFWEVCAEVVGEGGKVMVGYENFPETLQALQRGVPPILTPLGSALRKAGFWGFKDWYYPEGWAEGGRKLQAERPRSQDLRRYQVMRKWEVRQVLPRLSPQDRERARAFLKELPFPVRLAGLYLVTDPRYLPTPEEWFTRIPAAFVGGVDVFQFRVKERRDLNRAVGERLREEAAQWGIEFVVNDDPKRAKDLDADGVHVGKEDPSVQQVRSIFPGYVGVSAYNDFNRAQHLVKEGADYVAFGSVFPSPTEPNRVRISLDIVKQARKVLGVPIVAIGGISQETLPKLLAHTGVDTVAVVSALLRASTPEDTRRQAEILKTILIRSLHKRSPFDS